MSAELDSKYFDEQGHLNDTYFKELRNAIKRGQTDIVTGMLEGANVEELSNYHYRGRGYTVLMEAVASGEEEMIDMLIEKGVDVNVPSSAGTKALGGYQPFEHNPETIAKINRINRKLLAAGAIDETGEFTKSEFVCAVEESNLDKVKELIAQGIDVNADNKDGNPLWEKAFNNPEMLQTLIAAGLNLETYNDMGHTALIYALYKGDNKTALELIEAGADVKTRAKGGSIDGFTPLHFAGKELTPVLIAKGADVNAMATDGSTPMVNHFSVEKMKALYDAGASLEIKDGGKTLMTIAALAQDVESMKFLQEKGFDINQPDDNGWTPLKYAAAAKSKVAITSPNGGIIIKLKEADPKVVQQMIDMGGKVLGSGALDVVGQGEMGIQIREILEKRLNEEKKNLHQDLSMQRQVANKTEERQCNVLTSSNGNNTSKNAQQGMSSSMLLVAKLAARKQRA